MDAIDFRSQSRKIHPVWRKPQKQQQQQLTELLEAVFAFVFECGNGGIGADCRDGEVCQLVGWLVHELAG